MSSHNNSFLIDVSSFESLISYFTEKLEWPIEEKNIDDITFDYAPEDLGIEAKHVPKIIAIKQIRPFSDKQPWGIFHIEFESKKLPVVVLRRILKALIISTRNKDDRIKSWDLQHIIFISSLGENNNRQISFSHFSETDNGIQELRTFSWDSHDTHFHYEQSKLDLEKLRWPKDETDIEAWHKQWSEAFRLRHREVIQTSQELAIAMAHIACKIREQVKEVFKYEIEEGPLHNLYNNFKQVLIHDLTIESFADVYAQTITYGLFSARASHDGDFKIEKISSILPNTNPFLKSLFEECAKIHYSASQSLDFEELGINDLIILLKESNIEAVLQDFGRQKKGEDPVIHFYEDFLREYNSHQKVERGVFYTPDSVVSFIVKSVDSLLKTEFCIHDGLADISTTKVKYKRLSKIKSKRKSETGDNWVEDTKIEPFVQVLDPATGTGTFLKYVIKQIKETFDKNNSNLNEDELIKKWNYYVSNNLLSRVFGFELMAAPYAVAHLKIGLELAETGYAFESDKRLGIYLTNTLEGTHEEAGTLNSFLNWLAEEGRKADTVKEEKPISVVIGNPPYSGHSANESQWIANLLRGKIKGEPGKANYFEVEGKPLDEKNPKWLNDDYVKFIRFGQWRIDKTGNGILAFITNHGYLDNPTFRGMRQQLMYSFSDIYILDLHGNSKKKEKCPDGSKDENVFDIQQGVSIGFFVKKSNHEKQTNIYYADMWGTRDQKYSKLLENDITTIEWEKINPASPFYLFKPQDSGLRTEYENGWKVTDIMLSNVLGFQTHRDHFAIDFEDDVLHERISTLRDNHFKDEDIKKIYNLKDTEDWNLHIAREQVRNDNIWETKFQKCYYRPFDRRFCFYSSSIIDRPRQELLNHVAGKDNLCIGIGRQGIAVQDPIWSLITIAEEPIDANIFRRGGVNVFPLYLYYEEGQVVRREYNLNPEFIKQIEIDTNLKFIDDEKIVSVETFSAKELIYYIYAYLNSPKYRTRYEEFLKIDFPIIHLTKNKLLFKELVELGADLSSLHLMKSNYSNDFVTTYTGKGINEVETIGKNSYKDGRLYINKHQYFEGIPEEVYNFYIGGYQVCQKWLKDRKGRTLTEDEIEHYQRIILIIRETIHLMGKIDETIEEHGGWPIK